MRQLGGESILVTATGTLDEPADVDDSARQARAHGPVRLRRVARLGVHGVLAAGAGSGTPSEPQEGVHACAWKASDGHAARVVLLIDNADKTHVDSLDVTNEAAGTDFSGVTYSSKDVGAREVRASYLTNGEVHSTPPGLGEAAATVRDVIYQQVLG